MSTITADLQFSVEIGDRSAHGSLRSQGRRLVLEVDDPVMFAGPHDAAAIRATADALARQGLVLEVVTRGRRLITIGAVVTPWWQRRVTRSRHIRLGSARGAWTSAKARIDRSPSVMPESSLAPPPTLFPLVPTLHRRFRGPITTTHDPAHGGAARLVEVKAAWNGTRPSTHWLEETTWIGSDGSCDVVVEGLAPRHAKVVHDEDDEYVVRAVDGSVRVHGAPVNRQILRTGARVDLGDTYTLVFRREEYADHGRPYGGRIGGELGHQRPQPPRSALSGDNGDTPVA